MFIGKSQIGLALAVLTLAACGGGGVSPAPVTIGGTVSGLAGSALVLADNGSDHLTVSGNGSFTFASKIPVGSAYSVSVVTEPTSPSQSCVVANGSGQAGVTAVTNASVTCSTNTYTVAGAVYGLVGAAIQLSDNGVDTISVNADGNFAFPIPIASGSAYTVTIKAQPTDLSQHCSVSNGIGTIGAADVANLAVRCAKAGRFLYITEHLMNAIVGHGGLPPGGVLAYSIVAATGAFPPVPGSPFATDKCPCTLSVTPDGKFAYVGSHGTLYPYRINEVTGALSAAGTGTGIGGDSGTIGADPKSKFVYVANPAANTLSAYVIDPTSGTLTPAVGSPFPAGISPAGLGFDPSGKFLYVANRGSNNISAYTIDAMSGALTAIPGSPFAVNVSPDSVSVEASGHSLYATNGSSAPVARFAIDAATGALSPLATTPLSPNPPLLPPSAFLLDPNSNRAYLIGECFDNHDGKCVHVGGFYRPFEYHLWPFAFDDQSGAFIQSDASQHLFALDELSGLDSMQIDPSGKFVCARILSFAIARQVLFDCYLIDSTTGVPSSAFGGVASIPDSGTSPVEDWDAITIAR